VIIPDVVLIQLSSWGWSHSCSKHVEDSNKHVIEEIVRQDGYLSELHSYVLTYKPYRTEQNSKKKQTPFHTTHHVIRKARGFPLTIPTQWLVTITVYRNWEILGWRKIEIWLRVNNYVRGSGISLRWKHHSIIFCHSCTVHFEVILPFISPNNALCTDTRTNRTGLTFKSRASYI